MLVYDNAIKGLAPLVSEDETNTTQMKTEKKRTPKFEKMKKAAMQAKRMQNEVIQIKTGVGGGGAAGASENTSLSSSRRRHVVDSVTFGDGSVAYTGDLVLVARADQRMITAVLGDHQNGNMSRCC